MNIIDRYKEIKSKVKNYRSYWYPNIIIQNKDTLFCKIRTHNSIESLHDSHREVPPLLQPTLEIKEQLMRDPEV